MFTFILEKKPRQQAGKPSQSEQQRDGKAMAMGREDVGDGALCRQ